MELLNYIFQLNKISFISDFFSIKKVTFFIWNSIKMVAKESIFLGGFCDE